jgi:hypothetical protein
MKRFLKLFYAHIRLTLYLLRKGTWYGEMWFTGYSRDGNKIIYLASVTGSIWNGTIKPVKVFWDETKEKENK